MKSAHHVQLVLKGDIPDVAGARLRQESTKYLGFDTGNIRTGKIFSVVSDLSLDQIENFAHTALKDPIIHDVYIDVLFRSDRFKSHILVAKLPGVTDDEGISAQKTLCDVFDIELETAAQWIFTQDFYYIEHALELDTLRRMAEELLGNSLINHFEFGRIEDAAYYIPEVRISREIKSDFVDIFVSDDRLVELSKSRLLSLNLDEMKAIQDHYKSYASRVERGDVGLPESPTDCELEIIAQTWSEHCKHKEFNAIIDFKDLDSGDSYQIDSLFKTYITRATEIISSRLERGGKNWLLKVFADNAGVVRIDEKRVFIWKVETHNSPSALDPYGGALTGIVGVNRDPLGTGIGGGKLLFNTNVLCFGSPDYEGRLLKGQLHPRRILAGVVKGIEDGGNKSGIPTVNGCVVFDDRFRGKPLVYCGTGAIMPSSYLGRESWEKSVKAGDRIVMAGGRVGKDGIHGATFSSAEIDEHSPRSAVQIGSPITQKNLSDFMERACILGLIRCSTDDGAGGLSSSVGEMALFSGGAIVHLEKVPLKYPGLEPWEIFVSESQERMTFVVEQDKEEQLFELAEKFEVELSDIGEFTNKGKLDVRYENRRVAYLDLDFLHDGIPRKHMIAEWKKPHLTEPELPVLIDYNDILLRLLGSLNICSKELIIRRYDHEVKGRTILKPLMGPMGLAPQDAAVMRLGFDSYAGIAISNGIIPRYGDIDAYAMSAGAFDEAVRQIIAIGGKLPDPEDPDNRFWSVNDNFCVPDSAYHASRNPDGKYKLAQLVRMCEALFDMSTFFNIPMTSGKDSMKNDFVGEGVRISIPPTILYSVVAKIDDIRNTVTSEFKRAGDLVFLVGTTYDELGGSEFYRLFDTVGANVPIVRMEEAKRLYQMMNRAHEAGLIESSHDISDGGMAVAVAEAAFGSELGVSLDLEDRGLSLRAELFSESHSRFIVTVRPDLSESFQSIMGTASYLGKVTDEKRVVVRFDGEIAVDIGFERLREAWSNGLKM